MLVKVSKKIAYLGINQGPDWSPWLIWDKPMSDRMSPCPIGHSLRECFYAAAVVRGETQKFEWTESPFFKASDYLEGLGDVTT